MRLKLHFWIGAFVMAPVLFFSRAGDSASVPSSLPLIPKAWDDAELRTLEVPLANPAFSPKHVPASFYYQVPERPIYKSYPVYAAGREPQGYWEDLQKQKPEVIWGRDENGVEHRPALGTKADWIRAGELVFDAAISYSGGSETAISLANVRDPRYYAAVQPPLTADGTFAFGSYVIRKAGKVELGRFSCGACHTRVLAGGRVVKGAQGNFPFDRTVAYNVAALKNAPPEKQRAAAGGFAGLTHVFFGAPWLRPDPADAYSPVTAERVEQILQAIPPGVIDRQGGSALYPAQIPDLIGVQSRRYLDHTGLLRHRGPADIMRYASLNQDMNLWSRYGDWIPAAKDGQLPPPATLSRYSDEQLYALALFLYSLEPPPNPNKVDDVARAGQQVFAKAGCGGCHPAPLYTNNKLTLAKGFALPADTQGDAVMPLSVGTDPRWAVETRRGTGYYKVPSLQGVWYRGPLSHDGSVATLEDWFDPARLRDDYIPTGFIGVDRKHRAVPGHEFGLHLGPEERRALIAFLRTL
ncbi:MAG TPA: hypothetical protein VH477_06935 [Bryobacteraceae bacterium]